jgi:hypothetical protein
MTPGKAKFLTIFAFIVIMSVWLTQSCLAGEDLITTAQDKSGKTIPYILNYRNLSPKYAVIFFPGGSGDVDPRREEGRLVYNLYDNFLLRSREFLVDEEFTTVTTNSTDEKERIQAVIDDLRRRFPEAHIYLMGTSRGTLATMALAGYLSDKVAGEIHTSSMQDIEYFDPRKYKNRHLIVHHQDDSCRKTPLYAAEASHRKYGTDIILMKGGKSEGNECKAFAHHGFNGIERETIDAIKKWIKQGDPR